MLSPGSYTIIRAHVDHELTHVPRALWLSLLALQYPTLLHTCEGVAITPHRASGHTVWWGTTPNPAHISESLEGDLENSNNGSWTHSFHQNLKWAELDF